MGIHPLARECKELEDFLYNNLYKHYKVERMTRKAQHFIEELFNTYLNDPRQLPPRYQKWAKDPACLPGLMAGIGGSKADPERGLRRSICDYISGMTDRYAQEEYKKLFHPFERI